MAARKTAKKRTPSARTPRERCHSLNVDLGLYLLRYVTTRTPDAAPLVRASAAAGNERYIAIVPAPGNAANVLREPGDCLFVRASRRGAVTLTVKPSVRGGSLDAEVRLERVTSATSVHTSEQRDVKQTSRDSARAVARSRNVPLHREPAIDVMAHVSHRGDIVAEQGQWLCGPELPIAIEGLQIDWRDQPEGLTLAYAVKTGSRDPQRIEAGAGGFAGTRGCALPIAAVEFALSGPQADEYELRCDALFLGAHVMSRTGRKVALAGPSGREPLVGLRLSIALRRNERASAQRSDFSASPLRDESGPVRIYRNDRLAPKRRTEGAYV